MDHDTKEERAYGARAVGNPSTGLGEVEPLASPGSSSCHSEFDGGAPLPQRTEETTRDDPISGVSEMRSPSARGDRSPELKMTEDDDDYSAVYDTDSEQISRSEEDLDNVSLEGCESNIEVYKGEDGRLSFKKLKKHAKKSIEKNHAKKDMKKTVRHSVRRKVYSSEESEMEEQAKKEEKHKMEKENRKAEKEGGKPGNEEEEDHQGKEESISESEIAMMKLSEENFAKVQDLKELQEILEDLRSEREILSSEGRESDKKRKDLEIEGLEEEILTKENLLMQNTEKLNELFEKSKVKRICSGTGTGTEEVESMEADSSLAAPGSSMEQPLSECEVTSAEKKILALDSSEKEKEADIIPKKVRVTKISKVNVPISSFVEVNEENLHIEMKKFYDSIVDLTDYLKTNKNIRNYYKEKCLSIPKELKHLIKLNKRLINKNKEVKSDMMKKDFADKKVQVKKVDVSVMTLPVPERMEICEQNEDSGPQITLPSAADLKQKKKINKSKNPKKTSKLDNNFSDVPCKDGGELSYAAALKQKINHNVNSEEDCKSENLEYTEELILVNLELLKLDREIQLHFSELSVINKQVLDIDKKFKNLKKISVVSRDKIDFTQEIISQMKDKLKYFEHNKEIVKKVENKTQAHAVERRKEELEESWNCIRQGKFLKKSIIDIPQKQNIKVTEGTQVKDLPIKDFKKKRTNRPKWSQQRPDAIMVSVNENLNFKSIYKKITYCKPDIKDKIVKIRKSRGGNVVLELDKNVKTAEIKNELFEVLEDGVECKILQKIFDLEVRNLDPCIEGEDLRSALALHLEIDKDILKIKTLRMTNTGEQLAVVETPTKFIDICMEKSKFRLGLSTVNLVPTPRIVMCFKCQASGHFSNNCSAQLLNGKKCRKCGQEGHFLDSCENKLNCYVCAANNRNVNHMSGSMACPLFRDLVHKKRDVFYRNYIERSRISKDNLANQERISKRLERERKKVVDLENKKISEEKEKAEAKVLEAKSKKAVEDPESGAHFTRMKKASGNKRKISSTSSSEDDQMWLDEV